MIKQARPKQAESTESKAPTGPRLVLSTVVTAETTEDELGRLVRASVTEAAKARPCKISIVVGPV